MSSDSQEIPVEGYVGTSHPRSGREIPLPEWVAALVSENEILKFSYHPEKYFPVFSPVSAALKQKKGEKWPSVGQNPVRIDDSEPVVQLPARFFSDYQGPQTMIELGPVVEQAQINPDEKFHFVIGWPSFTSGFQVFLLTTSELASTDAGLLPTLFSDHRQRSRLLGNLDDSDMKNYPDEVAKLFQRLSELITS